ncbi:glycoside hydrolase family 9 protein [Solimicrobium silvestre]|uniref:Glycosyl hydrolase family 9 n=1 Tax=Solimicrobium silvestre TaxID=2099400 RepID=A0A2S9GXP2_9BURK|nr:glycoside hydrolase family 9 protein [Solimicrobium silvestre]PRC92478.1 Glycosyl hydrolase family 9 [Solimicrobium silvestre]
MKLQNNKYESAHRYAPEKFHIKIGKVIGFCMLCAALPAWAVTGYLRINQVGYETDVAAQAYLMTSSPVSDVSFHVINSSGDTVTSGTVGAKTGTWGSYTVYPVNFTVADSGKYSISVSGPVSTSSPVFTVDTSTNLYSQALVNTLSFYQNQRDGSNFIPSALRTAAGHLNDANATVYKTPPITNDNITAKLSPTGQKINAEGGWWDAGDYLKFVQTHSYTVALMLTGVRDFPNQMGAGSAKSNFTSEAEFGLNWLQQMWDDSTQTLYYQVGIGTDFTVNSDVSDHDLWRLPQVDDNYVPPSATGLTVAQIPYIRNRPVFVSGPAGSKISPNLAGRLAADFALCYQVFKLSNPSYANKCLLEAEHVFALANTSPGTLLTVAPYDFYPETEWRDDMELGATELYFALQAGSLPAGLPVTNASYYLTQAANWAHAYITGPNDQADTLNLYDTSGLAHFELYRAIGMAGKPTLAVTQAALLSDLSSQMSTSVSQSGDPFGSPIGWKNGDTASHVSGLSVMASEYGYLTNSSSYTTDANRWAGNLLGANAWGVSFIVGDGTTFPNCIQHQVANISGSMNGKGNVLAGAVVEGPTNTASSGSLPGMVACPANGVDIYAKFNASGAVYRDNMQSYATNEPAIDLTAASMLMFAWQIAGAPNGTP